MSAPLVWAELWDAMKASPEQWIPTTETMYWDMLECLPPAAHSGGAFLVGEPDRHNSEGKAVYAGFKQTTSGFFARYLTLEQFRGLF